MKMNQPDGRSTAAVEGVLGASVSSVLTGMLGHEPVGLLAAGIDPAVIVLALLGNGSVKGSEITTDKFLTGDLSALFPEAAKRKAADEEEEDDDSEEEEEDDVVDDDEEDEDEAEEDEDLDEDEDEEDEDDEDEEDDEFDDPDEDDDFDDDDDEDDFDDDE